MRTTSTLEGFHSKLNKTIAKDPNFFEFVEKLKMHESKCADTMHSVIHDVLPSTHFEPKNPKDKERAEKINHFTKLLCSEKITPAEFLNAMADEKECKLQS